MTLGHIIWEHLENMPILGSVGPSDVFLGESSPEQLLQHALDRHPLLFATHPYF
jgi:hypothetical protein